MFTHIVRPFLVCASIVLGVALAAGEEVWFVGVASWPGANGTRWRSEAVLYNATGAPQEVRLELRARGFGTVTASRTLSLAAGEVRRLPDLYAALEAAPGTGVLRIEGPVMAWVRTFNQGEQGTFGQDVPPARIADAVPSEGTRLFPASASASLQAGFRSNLLLLNFGGQPATFTVRGCGASASIEAAGGAYEQMNNLAGWLGCPDGPFIVEVSGSGPWYGYVSTVDAVTGDPTTVRGVPAPQSGQPGNHAPVVVSFTATPGELVKGGDVVLRGAFADPDGEPVSWTIRIDPGATARAEITGPTSGTGPLASTVHTLDAGLLLVEVTVSDGRGGIATAVTGAVVLCHC
ncbi:MAG TPA: hypothetical protein P5234_16080 [Thermoanaerobaculaceae bacterium]|nr:hypothetical protein [Thermoanaerobaculaceae bacterium]HRS17756.1 hypothetical protein [Thermoanaerobaculaceae bacterium]